MTHAFPPPDALPHSPTEAEAPTGAMPLTSALALDVIAAPTPEVLTRIAAPGTAAVIWTRALAPDLARGLAQADPARLPSLRAEMALPQVAAAVRAAGADLPAPLASALAEDVAALALALGQATGAMRVTLRLEPVTTDACRRFHVDNVRARLLCTYRGQATQLAAPGEDATPRQMATGAVAILRGARWPGDEETGLRHRSPPIGGSGETRLLLVIDPAAPEDAVPD